MRIMPQRKFQNSEIQYAWVEVVEASFSELHPAGNNPFLDQPENAKRKKSWGSSDLRSTPVGHMLVLEKVSALEVSLSLQSLRRGSS
jgi:hypothetical protein